MQDNLSGGRKLSLAERLVGRVGTKGLFTESGVAGAPRAEARHVATPRPSPRPAHDPLPLGEEEPVVATQPTRPPLNLNYHRLQAAGFITPDSPRNSNTEEFRVIKRQLLKTAFNEDRSRRTTRSNVLMVTSSIPGEGKTFISMNLAMSFSMERDLHLLLVDTDTHRHALSTLVGADQQGNVGLVDLMLNPKLGIRDILLRTNLPNLSFIPSGRPHPQGVELLSSQEMVAVMDELAQRYPDRLIIIDTPPLLACTDGVALSSLVGHAIIVVSKDVTTKRQLNQTLEMLEGCENISCIMNMDSSHQRFSDYAYGY